MRIGRACENLFARVRILAGFCDGKSFRAGPCSPKGCRNYTRAGWADHYLMGFTYECINKNCARLRCSFVVLHNWVVLCELLNSVGLLIKPDLQIEQLRSAPLLISNSLAHISPCVHEFQLRCCFFSWITSSISFCSWIPSCIVDCVINV